MATAVYGTRVGCLSPRGSGRLGATEVRGRRSLTRGDGIPLDQCDRQLNAPGPTLGLIDALEEQPDRMTHELCKGLSDSGLCKGLSDSGQTRRDDRGPLHVVEPTRLDIVAAALSTDTYFADVDRAQEFAWLEARDLAVVMAKRLHRAGYDAIARRLLEPFLHVEVTATASDWDLFLQWTSQFPAGSDLAQLGHSIGEQLEKIEHA